MIALGGVIGSGLFVSSGYTIAQAGPLGAVIAYGVGALVTYLVMVCLGELAVAYPVSGGFHVYATRNLGPAWGFVTAWLYWLCWAVALGSEFTAAGILMQRWFPQVAVWIWCLIFAALLYVLNAISSRVFGEAEFWLSLIKVIAAIVPYSDASVNESPFVTVLDMVGLPAAADVMNFVIITALHSAGNSGLFSCARMLYSLAEEGQAPAVLARTTSRGIPLVSLTISLGFGLASLLSSVIAPDSLFLALVSISGFAVVTVWISIVASHIAFRIRLRKAGGDAADVAYHAPLYPIVPVAALVLLVASLIGVAFDPAQNAALRFGIPFTVLCLMYYRWKHGAGVFRSQAAPVGRGL